MKAAIETELYIKCACGNKISVDAAKNDAVKCCNCSILWVHTGQGEYKSQYTCKACGVTGDSALGCAEHHLCGPCYYMGIRIVGGKLCAQILRFLDQVEANKHSNWGGQLMRIREHQGWV